MQTLVGAEDDDQGEHFLPGPRAVHGGRGQRAGQEGLQVSASLCGDSSGDLERKQLERMEDL